MKEFIKNKDYLLSYSIKVFAFFLVTNLILWQSNFAVKDINDNILLSFIFCLSLLLCGLPSSILHNCAHNNFKPLWLNNLLGEFCGTLMLYGFKGFQLGHVFHHRYPDIKGLDPHPPAGLHFIPFLLSPIKETIKVIETAYYKHHGYSKSAKKNILLQKLFFNAGIILKTIFWYQFFGQKLFLYFYLPMYFSNIFVFAHINFATHRENNNKIEIINLNHNLYYKLVNLLSLGGYFHKNHHLRPHYINPMKVNLNNK